MILRINDDFEIEMVANQTMIWNNDYPELVAFDKPLYADTNIQIYCFKLAIRYMTQISCDNEFLELAKS